VRYTLALDEQPVTTEKLQTSKRVTRFEPKILSCKASVPRDAFSAYSLTSILEQRRHGCWGVQLRPTSSNRVATTLRNDLASLVNFGFGQFREFRATLPKHGDLKPCPFC
jgi:hypothetical protein